MRRHRRGPPCGLRQYSVWILVGSGRVSLLARHQPFMARIPTVDQRPAGLALRWRPTPRRARDCCGRCARRTARDRSRPTREGRFCALDGADLQQPAASPSSRAVPAVLGRSCAFPRVKPREHDCRLLARGWTRPRGRAAVRPSSLRPAHPQKALRSGARRSRSCTGGSPATRSHLDNTVQLVERVCIRHAYAAPDRRLDARQNDAQP